MKVTIVLFVLVALAMVALAAQPVTPEVSHAASALELEPVWMLLSGATLLAAASIVRRLTQ